ncbi:MAG: molecular chaperone HtpG [Porticoccaceae bacterium]
MTAAANPEKMGFQTEAKKILHLMIHSLYSNREIFLRELVSNASDACDKLRFEALQAPELLEGGADPGIRISFDSEAGTLTISDNGIGMSRQEVIDNLGTIARSGTAQFLEALSGDQKKDSQLIGQFGVGFYSSFIVADKVVVETRRAGLGADQGVRWTCEGEAEFTVEDVDKAERGTVITLHLKDDAKEFADAWRLRSLIKKYSDHIAVPISLPATKAEDESADEEWEVVNDATALWVKPKSELSDDDYKNFYKHVSHDFRDPLTWSHNRVEGKFDYTSLLYIPSEPMFDLYQREAPRGVKLYVQRTFIMDDAEQFLPLYLRFVKGVVDSNDLPLNVSREILQDSAAVTSIRTALTKRVLDMLESLVKDRPEDYGSFWEHFGSVLKEGVAEDFANRERIAKLLRFNSTTSANSDDRTSLDAYKSRAGDEHKKIYFLIADSYKAAASSPYLEIFRKKGIEVLLLTDRIDEWLMSYLTEFDGTPLQNIAKGELDFADEDGKESADDKPEEGKTSPLTEKIKSHLGDEVEDVRITRRLTESPACLVGAEHDLGVQMRKLLEAAGQAVPHSKPVLEINPDHPLLTELAAQEGDRGEDLAWVIYGQAQLSAGEQLENPAEFVQRLNRLLLRATV